MTPSSSLDEALRVTDEEEYQPRTLAVAIEIIADQQYEIKELEASIKALREELRELEDDLFAAEQLIGDLKMELAEELER